MLLLGVLLLFGFSHAFFDCFFTAGGRYGVDPYLLASIAKVESSLNPKAINTNADGSQDYGLMQINSYWVKKYKIPREWLFNACYNIHMGAMVLRHCQDRYPDSLIKTIDCYNKGKPVGLTEYVIRVYGEYLRLVANGK